MVFYFSLFLFTLFNHASSLPDPGFVINISNNKSDGYTYSDSPPDPRPSHPGTKLISQGDTDQPQADKAGDHWEERVASSAERSVEHV